MVVLSNLQQDENTVVLQKTLECWNLEFQCDTFLQAILVLFADNFGHLCRQCSYIWRQNIYMKKLLANIESFWHSRLQDFWVSARLHHCLGWKHQPDPGICALDSTADSPLECNLVNRFSKFTKTLFRKIFIPHSKKFYFRKILIIFAKLFCQIFCIHFCEICENVCNIFNTYAGFFIMLLILVKLVINSMNEKTNKKVK